MIKKKMPMRLCLGCQEMKPKRELIRVVKNQEGVIAIDFKGKKPGRGAYICNQLACFQKARKAKRLERAFESAIDPMVYEILEEELSKQHD
ncbi:MAG: YlxR family protein [Hyphomonadaceae bacterium]|nr:YlxR family protein [Clostridia bacterium]